MIPDQQVTAPAQPPQIQKIVKGISREKWSKIVGVSVGAVAAALVLAVAGIWLWRRQSIANTSSKFQLSTIKLHNLFIFRQVAR